MYLERISSQCFSKFLYKMDYYDDSDQFSDQNESDFEGFVENTSETLSEFSSEDDDDMPPAQLNNSWSKFHEQMNKFQFQGNPGLKCRMPNNATPMDFFELLADEEFYNLIVQETNRYAHQLIECSENNNYFMQVSDHHIGEGGAIKFLCCFTISRPQNVNCKCTKFMVFKIFFYSIGKILQLKSSRCFWVFYFTWVFINFLV